MIPVSANTNIDIFSQCNAQSEYYFKLFSTLTKLHLYIDSTKRSIIQCCPNSENSFEVPKNALPLNYKQLRL